MVGCERRERKRKVEFDVFEFEVFRDLTKSSQVRLHFYFTYGF